MVIKNSSQIEISPISPRVQGNDIDVGIRVNLGNGAYWNQPNLNQILGAMAMNFSTAFGKNVSCKLTAIFQQFY